MTGDPIDYSRPVGWWCPVCGSTIWFGSCHGEPCVPVYLPIPEGQRPLVDDEVESAEVVTWCGIAYDWHSRPDHTFKRWVVSVETDAERHINYIVTGATE